MSQRTLSHHSSSKRTLCITHESAEMYYYITGQVSGHVLHHSSSQRTSITSLVETADTDITSLTESADTYFTTYRVSGHVLHYITHRVGGHFHTTCESAYTCYITHRSADKYYNTRRVCRHIHFFLLHHSPSQPITYHTITNSANNVSHHS